MQCKLGLHITDDWRYSLPVFDSIDFELYEISNILVKKNVLLYSIRKQTLTQQNIQYHSNITAIFYITYAVYVYRYIDSDNHLWYKNKIEITLEVLLL